MSDAPTPGASGAGDSATGNARHVIRLRRPWLAEPSASPDSKLLTYTRRFGAPSNLTPEDCVELVLAGLNGLDAVWLNGKQLEAETSGEHVRVDITRELASRNELKLTIQPTCQGDDRNPEPADETWQESGAVRIEIRQR